MFVLWKLFSEKHIILYFKTTLTLKKPHCKNFWTLKMKVVSAIQVIKSKKQCFWLCLDRTYSVVFSTHFLRVHLLHPCKNMLWKIRSKIILHNSKVLLQTNSNKMQKPLIIKVSSRYDHGQVNIKLPKKEYRILCSQDKNYDQI